MQYVGNNPFMNWKYSREVPPRMPSVTDPVSTL